MTNPCYFAGINLLNLGMSRDQRDWNCQFAGQLETLGGIKAAQKDLEAMLTSRLFFLTHTNSDQDHVGIVGEADTDSQITDGGFG